MLISQTGQSSFEAENEIGAIDVFGAVRRRKWIGGAVGFVCLCVAVSVAVLWPPTYRSTATILIEEPDVPNDLVKTTVSTFADERLQVIQQRVMTNQNLGDIIDRFGLYGGAQSPNPRSQLLDYLRSKIALQVVSANLVGEQNRSNQQNPEASIAFAVSFEDRDPRVAQQVASQLTDLYLAENVQSRQEKSADTAEFLTQQSQKLYADVQDLQQQLTEFKTKYAGSLPEQLNVNVQILDQVQTELMQNRRDLESFSEKRDMLEAQLAQLSPYMPMTSEGQPATPQAQLMALELQYIDLSAKYGPKHPDVVHLEKQIETLKGQVGTTDNPVSSQAQLSQLQAQLADALQRYGEQHPEVLKLRKQLADLKSELAKAPRASLISAPKGPPDNPIYIQLQSELGDAKAQMEGVELQTAALQAKVTDLQARVLQTPALEGEYDALQKQYDAASKRYQDFKDKAADAAVAQSMELQSKSETFSVLDAPQIPDLPVKPNRKLLLLVGLVASCVMAASAMLSVELLDSRVYDQRGLQTVFGEAPLAMVPYIGTRRERINRWLSVGGIILVILGLLTAVLVAVNAMVMPLDVLVAALINRLNL